MGETPQVGGVWRQKLHQCLWVRLRAQLHHRRLKLARTPQDEGLHLIGVRELLIVLIDRVC